jgi:hypothetical protein
MHIFEILKVFLTFGKGQSAPFSKNDNSNRTATSKLGHYIRKSRRLFIESYWKNQRVYLRTNESKSLMKNDQFIFNRKMQHQSIINSDWDFTKIVIG